MKRKMRAQDSQYHVIQKRRVVSERREVEQDRLLDEQSIVEHPTKNNR